MAKRNNTTANVAYSNESINIIAKTVTEAVTASLTAALTQILQGNPVTTGTKSPVTPKGQGSKNAKTPKGSKAKEPQKPKASDRKESKTPEWMANKPSKKVVDSLKKAIATIEASASYKVGSRKALVIKEADGLFTIRANKALSIADQRSATFNGSDHKGQLFAAVKAVGFAKSCNNPDAPKEQQTWSYAIPNNVWEAAKKVAKA